jgi:NADPH-dependent glutamate synthase beta subunit-like oxidoreductase/dihydroorotate dehydrogenase
MGLPTDWSLPVTVAGLTFRNPFLVASGPTTKTVEQLVRAEETGWGGASLKLCFDPYPYINKEPRYGYWEDRGILSFSAEKRISLVEGLKLAKDGRKATKELKILANITYEGEKGIAGWVSMARQFEDAGVHAVELNMCCPNMSFNVQVTGSDTKGHATGASLGQQADTVAKIVEEIKKVVSIPLFVKITPEGGQQAHIAKRCIEAGADCVGTNANRLAVPPFDIENPEAPIYHLQTEPSMSCFCGPWLKPLALRDVFEMRKLIGPDALIFGSGGCRNWKDAVEFFMFGADIVQICTETLVSGFGFMPELLRGLKDYLARHDVSHPRDLRDKMVGRMTSATELTIFPGHARCKNQDLVAPCKFACPNHVPAQAYVTSVAKEDFQEAFRQITSRDPLQSICGWVCNHPCEDECTRGEVDEPIRIRDIKRFVLEKARAEGWKPEYKTRGSRRPEKVAVVGAGPAGLSAAFDLARAGYEVTIYEGADKAGGMLRGVIPAFRLPEAVLDDEVERVKSMGVTILTGRTLGHDFTVESLKAQGFSAILLALGAQAGATLGVPGENGAHGIIDALSFLKDGTHVKAVSGKRVAVVGGGFTAVDAARTAIRRGAKEVFILYRRTRDEMPATPEEVYEAEEEGVKVMYLVSPKALLAENGRVSGLRMVNHVLGEKDASSRRRPEEVEGTEFTLRCDIVIPAVGQKVLADVALSGVQVDEHATMAADEATGATSVDAVFAAGDCVTGPTSIIAATASGRRAAVTIDRYLAGEAAFLAYDPKYVAVDKAAPLLRIEHLKKVARVPVSSRPAGERRKDYQPYTEALSDEAAVAEASRCLACGCGAGCRICADICNAFAVTVEGDRIVYDETKCHACGMCYRRCPNRNIEIVQTSTEPIKNPEPPKPGTPCCPTK